MFILSPCLSCLYLHLNDGCASALFPSRRCLAMCKALCLLEELACAGIFGSSSIGRTSFWTVMLRSITGSILHCKYVSYKRFRESPAGRTEQLNSVWKGIVSSITNEMKPAVETKAVTSI